jgi:flagellar hook-length control protein FliK
MMTPPTTLSFDRLTPAAPETRPATEPAQADSEDFAALLAAAFLTPAPVQLPVETAEAAPELPVDGPQAVTELAPAALLPGEEIIALPALSAKPAALSAPAKAAAQAAAEPASGTELHVLPEAAAGEAIPAGPPPGEPASAAPSTRATQALLTPAPRADLSPAFSAPAHQTLARGEASGEAKLSWEITGEEPSATAALKTAAASRDVISLASLLAAAGRKTRPAPLASSLAPLLTDQHGAAKREPKPAADFAPPGQALQGLGAETTFALSDSAAGRDRAEAVTRQVIQPLLAAGEALAQRETRTLRLHLHPAELGEIEIHLRRDAEGRLSASLAAAEEIARRALFDGLGELRTALERAGLPVERLEVNLGMNAQAGSSREAEPQPQATSARLATTEQSGPQSAATGGATSAQDRLLSVRA